MEGDSDSSASATQVLVSQRYLSYHMKIAQLGIKNDFEIKIHSFLQMLLSFKKSEIPLGVLWRALDDTSRQFVIC